MIKVYKYVIIRHGSISTKLTRDEKKYVENIKSIYGDASFTSKTIYFKYKREFVNNKSLEKSLLDKISSGIYRKLIRLLNRYNMSEDVLIINTEPVEVKNSRLIVNYRFSIKRYTTLED